MKKKSGKVFRPAYVKDMKVIRHEQMHQLENRAPLSFDENQSTQIKKEDKQHHRSKQRKNNRSKKSLPTERPKQDVSGDLLLSFYNEERNILEEIRNEVLHEEGMKQDHNDLEERLSVSAGASGVTDREATMETVQEPVESEVKESVQESVESEVKKSVQESVKSEVKETLRESAESKVKEPVQESVESEVKESVQEEAESEVKKPVQESVESEVKETVQEEAESEVKKPVQEPVESEVKETLRESAESKVKEPVQEPVESEVKEPVQESVESEVKRVAQLSFQNQERNFLEELKKATLREEGTNQNPNHLEERLNVSAGTNGVKGREKVKKTVQEHVKSDVRETGERSFYHQERNFLEELKKATLREGGTNQNQNVLKEKFNVSIEASGVKDQEEEKNAVQESVDTELEGVVEAPVDTEAKEVEEAPVDTEAEEVVEEPVDTEAKEVVEAPVDTESKEVVEAPVDTESKEVVEAPVDTEAKEVVEAPVDTESEEVEEAPVDTEAEEVEEAPVDTESEEVEEAPVDTELEGVEEAPVDTESKEVEEAPVDTELEEVEEAPVDTELEGVEEAPVDTESEGVEEEPVDTELEEVEEEPVDTESEEVEEEPVDTESEEVEEEPADTESEEVEEEPVDTESEEALSAERELGSTQKEVESIQTTVMKDKQESIDRRNEGDIEITPLYDSKAKTTFNSMVPFASGNRVNLFLGGYEGNMNTNLGSLISFGESYSGIKIDSNGLDLSDGPVNYAFPVPYSGMITSFAVHFAVQEIISNSEEVSYGVLYQLYSNTTAPDILTPTDAKVFVNVSENHFVEKVESMHVPIQAGKQLLLVLTAYVEDTPIDFVNITILGYASAGLSIQFT
ncbi:hypothetical protein IC619_008000 [Hazenella sp. IB182353]|uniref:hypothetical protein n=1 Tax=Polycladospora coralii TaxID=2771432 RepID=UPI001746D1FC|nr:hypothetical protein [Polycladospora coralii]MBS7530433.1 hypothetical protein [Polycladospora coralii]